MWLFWEAMFSDCIMAGLRSTTFKALHNLVPFWSNHWPFCFPKYPPTSEGCCEENAQQTLKSHTNVHSNCYFNICTPWHFKAHSRLCLCSFTDRVFPAWRALLPFTLQNPTLPTHSSSLISWLSWILVESPLLSVPNATKGATPVVSP